MDCSDLPWFIILFFSLALLIWWLIVILIPACLPGEHFFVLLFRDLDEFIYCSDCGLCLNAPRLCSSCGASVTGDFCSSCGAPTDDVLDAEYEFIPDPEV